MLDGFEGDICSYEIEIGEGALECEDDEENCAIDLEMGFGFLRRCFENKITVEYCNHTSNPEDQVVIQVDLDSHLELNSSSIAYSNQNDTSIHFFVGFILEGQCGEFTFKVTPNCQAASLGQEHCLSAQVVSSTVCHEEDTEWMGANIEISAKCEDGRTYSLYQIRDQCLLLKS